MLKDGLTFPKQCLNFLTSTISPENSVDKGKNFSIKDGSIISILKLTDKGGRLMKKEKYLTCTKIMAINGKSSPSNSIIELITQ